eukprot:COSAG03_NODE_1389_length_4180_cov_8.803725_1_plen_118_part_10
MHLALDGCTAELVSDKGLEGGGVGIALTVHDLKAAKRSLELLESDVLCAVGTRRDVLPRTQLTTLVRFDIFKYPPAHTGIVLYCIGGFSHGKVKGLRISRPYGVKISRTRAFTAMVNV